MQHRTPMASQSRTGVSFRRYEISQWAARPGRREEQEVRPGSDGAPAIKRFGRLQEDGARFGSRVARFGPVLLTNFIDIWRGTFMKGVDHDVRGTAGDPAISISFSRPCSSSFGRAWRSWRCGSGWSRKAAPSRTRFDTGRLWSPNLGEPIWSAGRTGRRDRARFVFVHVEGLRELVSRCDLRPAELEGSFDQTRVVWRRQIGTPVSSPHACGRGEPVAVELQ